MKETVGTEPALRVIEVCVLSVYVLTGLHCNYILSPYKSHIICVVETVADVLVHGSEPQHLLCKVVRHLSRRGILHN
jgi:hypothetical protein